jgi:hypothetical protein
MSIRKEDKRAYSEKRAYLGNLGLLLWILLGTLAVWFYNSLCGWIFLFFAVLAIFGVVRKMVCKTCAYCTACTQGWGKLPELVFGKAELGGLTTRKLFRLIIFVNILLTIIPAVYVAVSISQAYAESKIAVLVFLLLISILSITPKRKREFMKN